MEKSRFGAGPVAAFGDTRCLAAGYCGVGLGIQRAKVQMSQQTERHAAKPWAEIYSRKEPFLLV